MFKVICLFIFVASTFKNSFWGETLPLLTVFKVIYPATGAARTFKNSFWGETLQLLTLCKVIYPVIWVAKTFKNSFWGETLQLLPMFKVICPSICVAIHLRIHSGEKLYSCSQCWSKTTKLILLDSLLQEAEHVARLSVSDSWGSQL
jgi:hypothetical protein